MPSDLYQRLAGAALGAMCGDALGMPVEGMPPEEIARRHGRLERLLPGRLPAGSYTDDFEMTLGILETLAEFGRLDAPYLASRWLANFQAWRGYGGRIAGVMERLRAGDAWNRVGTDSWGNGGAMRVGVLGVFHAEDEEALLAAALEQCRITHCHPRALAGAAAQALAVGLAVRLARRGQPIDRVAFVDHLVSRVTRLDRHTAARLRDMPRLAHDADAARKALCSAFARDVSASEAVPPAVGAFLWAVDAAGAADAVVMAVSLGGDADTIGAMAGALAGAYWGLEVLPGSWLRNLENGPGGRDDALALCGRICGENRPATPPKTG